MRREAAEEVGAQHRRHHRAVAARRLALDAAVPGFGERAVTPVDPRDELVAEVGVVAPDRGRVEELRAAELRPGVDPDDDRGRHVPGCEHVVAELRERLCAERRPVAPHVELAGVALDHVDRRVATFRLVLVTRREVDPQGPLVRVAERVPAERLAREDVLVEASGLRVAPGRRHAFGVVQGRRSASAT